MNVAINKENFKKLLKWLDSDEEKAAERYGHIHRALIKYFNAAGCSDSEELADETIDRMVGQIKKLNNYEGEKSRKSKISHGLPTHQNTLSWIELTFCYA